MKFEFKKTVQVLSAVGVCIIAAACGPDMNKERAVAALLGAQDNDTYDIVKSSTRVGGYAVLSSQKTGKYVAVRYDVFIAGMSYDEWVAAAGGTNVATIGGLHMVDNSHYEYSSTAGASFKDSSGAIHYQGGYVWVNEIDYEGHGYVFEDAAPHLKDLESIGASMQAANSDALRKTYMSQFGLSESRAAEVAGLVSNWSELSKKRQMTQADLTDFSTSVLGADLASFQRAAEIAHQKGDTSQLDALTKTAAKTNGISVEHARTILKGFLN